MSHKSTVDYIKSLGITSVELLPVHWFPDDQHLLDKGLKNFWGYNTLNFFAPATRYFGPRGIQGFRDMVRAFHDAGIEVILDVVYNHTAEGMSWGQRCRLKASITSPITVRCQTSIAITSTTPVPVTPSTPRIRVCCRWCSIRCVTGQNQCISTASVSIWVPFSVASLMVLTRAAASSMPSCRTRSCRRKS